MATYDPIYTPVIQNVFITPNPAKPGDTVTISVAAIDAVAYPYMQVITAGELSAGEF